MSTGVIIQLSRSRLGYYTRQLTVSKPSLKRCVFTDQLRQKEPSVYYMWQNFDVHLCLDELNCTSVILGMMQREGKGWMKNGHDSLC